MKRLIYFAEDEMNIRVAITAFLEKEGFKVIGFENGDLLYDMFLQQIPDLVILDLMMPGSSGFEICTKIRMMSNVPIIMLTARGSDEDYTTGIALGSDDYLTKPFSPVKLVMRVKALFRRLEMTSTVATNVTGNRIEYADITIDLEQMISTCRNKELKLTATELKLLIHLIKHQNKAVSRDELMLAVWEHEHVFESRVADDTVKRLRKKLTNVGTDVMIETVWGYGFRIGVRDE